MNFKTTIVLLVLLAAVGGYVGFSLLALCWVALPFWASTKAGVHRTRVVTGAGVLLLSYIVTFSALGVFFVMLGS